MSGARLVTLAGFAPDLREGLGRHGLSVTLGDEVPFTEYHADLTLVELAGLAPAAAALLGVESEAPPFVAEPFPLEASGDAGLEGAPTAFQLAPAAVELLSRVDDTRLHRLWGLWWDGVLAAGHRGRAPLDPELTQSIRGLVVQARAAVANGGIVVEAEQPPV